MQGKKCPSEIPIRYIKGVGPKMAVLLEKLGIKNAFDLLVYLPRRYEDRSNIVEVKDARPGETQAIIGKVQKVGTFRARTGTRITEIVVTDGKKSRIFAVWYNQPFMGKMFSIGQTIVMYGKVEVQARLQITHPVFEIVEKDSLEGSLSIGRIVPFYSLTENVTQKYLRRVVYEALFSAQMDIEDNLPTYIRAKKKLVDFKFAVENIHFPYSMENLERAYKRLVFEEFFLLQIVMAARRGRIKNKGIKHEKHEKLAEEFKKLFEFEFTGAQKKCIAQIEEDMAQDKPMYRLLQGDVGSGKTVVAMYALLMAIKGGHQTAIMVPTEILARQHYVTISKTFMPLGFNVRLLVGGIDESSRNFIKEEISRGETDIIVGTHALIQEGIDYKKLGLVIIDEQHKFGVEQRTGLRQKGEMPDTLVMTATPIPRSLVLTVFGDMDISYMKEKPVGREPITTYWVGEEKRESVYEFVKDEIKKGHQVFMVYPRIKKTDASQLRAAEDMYEHLKADIFKGINVALIHGRMKTDEKDKIMDDFRKGRYDILVATTVIEVGVDVPNVTVMVVEHAERYGLAQLHQLRGRIGRGKFSSYCILIGEAKTDNSSERLSVMMETDDGFKISEKDLDIRGPGEFLGTRQSGLPELKFGNIVKDFSIMEEAREEAFKLINEDPRLEDPRNRNIKKLVEERFGKTLNIGDEHWIT